MCWSHGKKSVGNARRGLFFFFFFSKKKSYFIVCMLQCLASSLHVCAHIGLWDTCADQSRVNAKDTSVVRFSTTGEETTRILLSSVRPHIWPRVVLLIDFIDADVVLDRLPSPLRKSWCRPYLICVQNWLQESCCSTLTSDTGATMQTSYFWSEARRQSCSSKCFLLREDEHLKLKWTPVVMVCKYLIAER